MPQPFRYSGELWDSTTSLQYLRARWYDPSMGRFVNEDTYEGQIDNPLTHIDPSGHASCSSQSECQNLYRSIMQITAEDGFDEFLSPNIQAEIRNNESLINDTKDQKWKDYYSALNNYYRNQACNYVDCQNGEAEFVSTRQIAQDAGGSVSNYALTPVGLLQCNCFTAGTKVLTEDGEKPIEEIKLGDKVLAKNDQTNEISYQEVEMLFRKKVDETYNITVEGELITTTAEHPFWIVGKGWVKAKELLEGEKLLTSENKELLLDKIEVKKEHRTVYNFRVSAFHTYFVSNLNIWTHNMDSCGSLLDGAKTYQVYYGYTGRKIVYVGITNDFNRRKAEHGDRFDEIRPAYNGDFFSKWQARGLEQANIDELGMEKNGGQLQNKVNSISPYRVAVRSAIQAWVDWYRKK